MTDPRCSMGYALVVCLASVAAFFAMGAAIGVHLFNRRFGHG